MIDKEFLEREYLVKDRTALDIGLEIGKSDTQVRFWIKKHGLPVKARGGRRHTIDLTGKVFGEYTVLSQLPGNGHCSIWQCRCSCGKVKSVKGPMLRRNEVKSCGKCLQHYGWKGCGQLSGWYYSSLRNNAKRRNYEFNVTIEQLWSLYQDQNGLCALTGVPIYFTRNATNEDSSKKSQTASLDRIDNDKHYCIENVQWIHKDLNKIKREFNEDVFFKYVKQVYEYRNLKDFAKC